MRYVSHSPRETEKIGLRLAKKMGRNRIVALVGDIGGGKTYFAKGFAKGLGVRGVVNSPTFVLMKTYRVPGKKLRLFCHVDAYRLRKVGELLEVGLREYLDRPDAIVLIEWANKLKRLLHKLPLIEVKFTYAGPKKRIIEIRYHSSGKHK